MAGSLTSPGRCVLEGILAHFYAFVNAQAHDVLKGFDGFEPIEDDGTGLNVTINFIYMIYIHY